MKYTKTHIKTIHNKWGANLIWIAALLFAISACSDNAVLTEQQPEEQISKIDGKPIITISDADFYQAKSAYLDKVMNSLSENGQMVVEALDLQINNRAINLRETGSDAVIVDFSNIKSTNAYLTSTANGSPTTNSLDDLSSHIRVVDRNGDVEEFELILQPHRGPNRSSLRSSATTNLSTESTWLALNPDHFYVQEDSEGNEIWPVTFPAVSMDDPDLEIEVTLDRDGTLTWPSKIQNNFSSSAPGSSTNIGSDNQLMYVDNMAITEPCFQDYDGGTCIDDGGGGGGGSTPTNDPDRFVTSEIKTASFLALKTIRLDGTGDGSGAAELQMHVEPYSSYSYKFNRQWNFVFDHKRGMTNRPLWFDDFSLRGIIINGYKLYNDLTGELRSSAESIFSDRNTRTFAADSRIYQTPDVNYENQDYNFTNMRSWSYLFLPTFQSGYTESSRLSYFPIVPLGSFSWRVLLMEDDTKYPYASGNGRSTLAHNVWTFNMANGSYSNIYTKVDANNHSSGSSDDLMWHSGISNITEYNVNQRLGGDSEITTISPAGFKYVLKKIYRTAEFRPSN